MNSIRCTNCGFENTEEARYCIKCGYPLQDTRQQPPGEDTISTGVPTGSKVCSGCGAINASSSNYCYRCGLLLPRQFSTEMEHAENLAGFWIRLGAYLIDGIFITVISLLIATTFTDTNLSQVWAIFAGEVEDWTISIIPTIIDIAYFTYCNGKWGQTIGKAVLGIKVFRNDDSPVSYQRSFARGLAYYLSALIFGIGFLMIAFSSRKRGLHDHICDTKVLKIRK